jgi:2-oxoglutarate ferredoxin oxidoreductase subunit gamma
MSHTTGGESDNTFYHAVIIAGFGGQGVLMIGNLLAYAAMREGRCVSYLPIYGVEMRGGTADCTVVMSSQPIGSPIVDAVQCVVAMNPNSLVKYEQRVHAHGLLLINSSLIDPGEVSRKDLDLFSIPFNDLAKDTGNPRLANMVALGALVEKTKLVKMASLADSLEKVLDARYHSLIPSNIKALERGAEFIRSLERL